MALTLVQTARFIVFTQELVWQMLHINRLKIVCIHWYCIFSFLRILTESMSTEIFYYIIREKSSQYEQHCYRAIDCFFNLVFLGGIFRNNQIYICNNTWKSLRFAFFSSSIPRPSAFLCLINFKKVKKGGWWGYYATYNMEYFVLWKSTTINIKQIKCTTCWQIVTFLWYFGWLFSCNSTLQHSYTTKSHNDNNCTLIVSSWLYYRGLFH